MTEQASEQPLADWSDLVLVLGGDAEMRSFTNELLRLAQKADPVNRHRLRIAFPREVRAWELWMELAPEVNASQLKQMIDGDPVTSAFVAIAQNLDQLQAFRRAVLGG